MGITDTEGNTGKRVPARLGIVPTDVPPWLEKEHGSLGRGVTWQDAPAERIKALIDVVTRTDAAISFSAGRDHRSVSVTILAGPDRPKFYASTPAELESLIRRLIGSD